jgi:pimeloyl-ACP methyl ester carboxylesterase
MIMGSTEARSLPKTHHSFCPSLALSVHGIRTRGTWQKSFDAVMSGTAMQLDAYDYGYYGLPRLLSPGFNSRKIDEFYEWYSRVVRDHDSVDLRLYDKRPSVVAHSFGTWIVGYAMLKYEDIRFDKMILIGCIPRNFDWGKLFARDQVASVRNECGLKDPWPRWAGRLVSGAGDAGTAGFDWF